MMQDDQPIQISVTPSQADELLNKLAEDDDFRQQLEADPQGVLAQYGIVVPEEALQGETLLPPKEEVREALSQMAAPELHPEVGQAAIFRRFVPLMIFLRRFRLPPPPPPPPPPPTP
jgi:putative modified peptide